MSNIFTQDTNIAIGKTLVHGWEPVHLQFTSGIRTIIHFSNDKHAHASCLRCPNTPCLKLAPNEIIPDNFDRFPADRNTNACAALAISIGTSGAPVIDPERCMMCGVCAARCSVGAIRLVPDQGAFVEDTPNEAFVEHHAEKTWSNKALLKRFAALDADGSMLEESDDIVDDIFERSNRAWSLVGDRYPNMLARNLLIGAGLGAAVGRKGNNHMRMDVLLSPPGIEHGVAEVEFGQEAVLSAPRDILDGLAILVSRYCWTVDTTTSLIVTDMLPNKRSEYWHIIQDIAKVLNVHIGTVTVFALMLVIWNRKILDLRRGHPFYVDRANESYRSKVLEKLMRRSIYLGSNPRPQVDIAK